MGGEGTDMRISPLPLNPLPVEKEDKIPDTVSHEGDPKESRMKPEDRAEIMDVRVGSRFRMLERLGSGSFGDIFRGIDVITAEPVAIKLEPAASRQPQLLNEARLVKLLSSDGPSGNPDTLDGTGIPRVHWYGLEGDYNVMVMTLLGPSLEDLFNFCGRRFSVRAACFVGTQMISRLEYMHSKHMIHRDIKPDNFTLGVGSKRDTVFLIDYGLAKPYRDPKTLKHAPYKLSKGLSGTARYASRNTHMGVEQSRRDDLEAVGYVLLYFLRGSLPWQGLVIPKKGTQPASPTASPKSPKPGNQKNEADNEKTKRIGQRKVSYPMAELCQGLPPQFEEFLGYCGDLGFNAKPDYDHLRNLLRLAEGKYAEEGELDWVIRAKYVEERRTQQRMLESFRSDTTGSVPGIMSPTAAHVRNRQQNNQ
eukprot:Hpha_TRINITY_DN15984_c2_g11::TRINITY_DN15984_c2_g11_i1::g.72899::m.72899/K02218/CSNK1, CKI; casein kinase 1